MKRWRGLVDLVVQGVQAGSTAIEKVQKDGAAVPFGVLEALPGVGAAARLVHRVHDGAVSMTHASVRGVAGAVGAGIGAVLEASGRGGDGSAPAAGEQEQRG